MDVEMCTKDDVLKKIPKLVDIEYKIMYNRSIKNDEHQF